MAKGRPRIPDSLHKLRGTYRQDRHGPVAKLGASSDPPEMPQDFDGRQARMWEGLESKLKPLGLWSTTFAVVIELLVRTYVRYREVDEDVRTHGAILTAPKVDRNGNTLVATFANGRRTPIYERKTNPAQIECTKLAKELRLTCAQLGLDPSSLSRLELSQVERDEFDDLSIVG